MDFRLGKEIERASSRSLAIPTSSRSPDRRAILDPDADGLMMKQMRHRRDCTASASAPHEPYRLRRVRARRLDRADSEQLVGDMRKAADLIKDKWPDLTVHIWMPHIDEEGHDTKVWIEKVE
jgi:hypothetical protein